MKPIRHNPHRNTAKRRWGANDAGISFGLISRIHKLTKTSVSGGGLSPGKTRDYAVTLEPGEYVFSCPLNTTPDYRLVVKGN